MSKNLYVCMLLLSLVFATGCGRRSPLLQECPEKMDCASGLLITKHNGYTQADVLDPWQKGGVLHRYYIVPKGDPVPDSLSADGTVVRTPLSNVLVYSDVHACLIDELGCVDAVGSVCDAGFFKTRAIVDGLADGSVTDCGPTATPVTERVIAAQPDAILLSPYQNAGYGTLANLGIPIIELADYMEQNPLGRAEWVKFIGLLFGKEELADSIYARTKTEYVRLKQLADSVSRRPMVLTETMTGGVWYVPGGDSYRVHLFLDAGASYPWQDERQAGSLACDFARVLDRAQSADFWFLTVYGYDLSREKMLEIYPHNDQFAAFRSGNVYYLNSAESRFFEETPFHPDLILKEYIKIFHPELLPDYTLKYYKKMED